MRSVRGREKCPRGAQTCARLFFADVVDLDLKPMTLKLDPDLDIRKMYPHTENEVAWSSHCKDIAWAEKNTKIALKVKGQGQISPTFKNC